jgi:aminopeptidase N
MKLFLVCMLLVSGAMATENDLSHRPKSFTFQNSKAVFVDFTEAHYDITYNLNQKTAFVTARIKFVAPEKGMPIFDSVMEPTSVKLDGVSVTASETKTPDRETTLRVVNKTVSTSQHELIIDVPLNTLVEFQAEGIKSAFWTSDLDEREFLERYMPANFEFDQVKMTFNVKFIGLKNKQAIYSNGVVKELSGDHFQVSFPSHFTASSIFFHTVPANAVDEIRYSLKSIDGRNIPVVIYVSKSSWGNNATTLERFKTETNAVFHELESDYGAFPHPGLTIYNAGRGGMEYCGATMTEFRALGHELFHSYFARGVMPANGNSGWLDEALASWRDDGYQSISTLYGTSRMSAHPYYTRTTDTAAYSFGERFMSFMDYKLKEKGGLKPFMRFLIDKKVFSPIFVEEFIKEMESFYGMSVEEDFRRYTYGKKNRFQIDSRKSHSHRFHQKMSVSELKEFL